MKLKENIEILILRNMLSNILGVTSTSHDFIEDICEQYFNKYDKTNAKSLQEQFDLFSNQTNEPKAVKAALVEIFKSYEATCALNV